MPCSVGRGTQKYKGSVAASTLQDVTENGNTTTLSIQTDSFFIGDGSLLTNIPGVSGYGTLEQVTASGNTTSHEVTFENTFTSLEALGNVVVVGNVTALTYYGDGANLTGIVTLIDFADNVLRIANLESNLVANSTRITDVVDDLGSNVLRIVNLESNLVANSTRITDVVDDLGSNVLRIVNLETEIQPVTRGGTGLSSFTQGDILYASGANQLSALSIGSIGVGNVLTVTGTGSLGWQPPTGGGGGTEVGNLQEVTTNGSTTSIEVSFTNTNTSFRAAGNVVVTGNITALTYYGDGSNLSGIPDVSRVENLESNLIANSTRITNLTNLPIVANTSTLTGVSKGDLLYASADNQITSLALSATDGHVLTVDGVSGVPAWEAPTGGGSTFNNITESGGNTGISNVNPQHTLHIGSNVVIDDTGADVVYVRGNIYATHDISVVGSTFSDQLHCQRIFIKNTQVVAERPTRVLRLT